MGYFAGKKFRNPSLTDARAFPTGSPASRILFGAHQIQAMTGLNSDAYRQLLKAGEEKYDYNKRGGIKSAKVGPGGGIGHSQYTGPFMGVGNKGSKEQYMAFSPLGQKLWHGGKDKEYGGIGWRWDDDSAQAKKDAEAKMGKYVGPSWTGGWRAEDESFSERKNRLQGWGEWKRGHGLEPFLTMTDLDEGHTRRTAVGDQNYYSTQSKFGEDLTPSQIEAVKAGTFNPKDITGAVGDDDQTRLTELTPLYDKSEGELRDLLMREFGTTNLRVGGGGGQITTYEDSAEAAEKRGLASTRAQKFGNLWQGNVEDSVAFLEQMGKDLSPENLVGQGKDPIFEIQMEEDDPSTEDVDESLNINWDATMAGGDPQTKFAVAIEDYLGENIGGWQPNISDKGGLINEFLTTDLSNVFGTFEKKAEARRKTEFDIGAQKNAINKLEREKALEANPVRKGLLDQAIQKQKRAYGSGFAAVGESPLIQGTERELLAGGKQSLRDINQSLTGERFQLDELQATLDAQKQAEQLLIRTMGDPWQRLTNRISAQQGEWGENYVPKQKAWETDLWEQLSLDMGTRATGF